MRGLVIVPAKIRVCRSSILVDEFERVPGDPDWIVGEKWTPANGDGLGMTASICLRGNAAVRRWLLTKHMLVR